MQEQCINTDGARMGARMDGVGARCDNERGNEGMNGKVFKCLAFWLVCCERNRQRFFGALESSSELSIPSTFLVHLLHMRFTKTERERDSAREREIHKRFYVNVLVGSQCVATTPLLPARFDFGLDLCKLLVEHCQ
jgi:hypothetical protein